jgi:hypothetical protein
MFNHEGPPFSCSSPQPPRRNSPPPFFRTRKYWGDGKAEFNIYDAQQTRYGQPRPSEVIHILVREPFSNRELVKAEPGTRSGTYPVIKLNQVLHIPTGLHAYQQMHSAFWRCDSGALIKATLTSNDSFGNTYKEFRALGGLRGLLENGWRYEWRTYWEGMSAGEEIISAEAKVVFYDELPLRVRTIDFSNGAGAFATAIAPSVINSKRDQITFVSASVDWAVHADSITVRVTIGPVGDGAKRDDFRLEKAAPHLPARMETVRRRQPDAPPQPQDRLLELQQARRQRACTRTAVRAARHHLQKIFLNSRAVGGLAVGINRNLLVLRIPPFAIIVLISQRTPSPRTKTHSRNSSVPPSR